MTTPHRTLREAAQMALDALLTGYHQGTQDAIAALREALAAPEPEPVALESVHLTRDTKGMCVVRVNGRVAIRDNGDIIDHMATLEWFAAPPAAPAPAAPAQPAVRHVRKIGGSFQHTGTVVADFKTTAGEPRIVLEFDAPVAGMLHVYRPDQVEPCESAAPAVRELQDDLIESVIRDVAELDYSSLPDMPEVMLVTANELRGILQAHGITGGSNG